MLLDHRLVIAFVPLALHVQVESLLLLGVSRHFLDFHRLHLVLHLLAAHVLHVPIFMLPVPVLLIDQLDLRPHDLLLVIQTTTRVYQFEQHFPSVLCDFESERLLDSALDGALVRTHLVLVQTPDDPHETLVTDERQLHAQQRQRLHVAELSQRRLDVPLLFRPQQQLFRLVQCRIRQLSLDHTCDTLVFQHQMALGGLIPEHVQHQSHSV